MSTEYYLRRAPKVCPTCGHDPMAEEIPIGHSAAGWVFLWKGWRAGQGGPAAGALSAPSDWFAFLSEQVKRGSVIVDEYDQVHTLAWFIEFVESKRRPRLRDERAPLRYSDLEGRIVPIDGDDFDFQGSA